MPPYGACLLGSFNLVKYLIKGKNGFSFNWTSFKDDIPTVVRAMDNIIDRTIYPLKEQEEEAKNKRRMGLGVTGLANTGEALGYRYGSNTFIDFTDTIMKVLANTAYQSSALLAEEKGSFPLYDEEKYLDSKFVKGLSNRTKGMIRKHGIRNSHLISIAPTGTISLSADNVSSSIEPPFSHFYDRTIKVAGGEKIERVYDYGHQFLGVDGKTADECSVKEHLGVLLAATRWSDSAVSKTLNVGDNVTWEEFKSVYMDAWKGGAKGCTTFRAAGKRYGVLNKVEVEEGSACYFDLETGKKTCE